MSFQAECSYCKKTNKIIAKGLCNTCYARYRRNGTAEYVRPNRSLGVRECSFCNSPNGPFIKSLCRACYQRQYANGTPVPQRMRNLCEATGCDEPVKANGLCGMHYARVRRHGSVDAGHPEGWGAKSAHPLWERWKSLTRVAPRKGGMDSAWKDFWAFLADVGEAPGDRHRLYRIDEALPYQKGNIEWRAGTVSV